MPKPRHRSRPCSIWFILRPTWLPSQEFQGRSKAGMYGDFLVMVDTMIGRVLKAMDQADLTHDTLVIFTADNGPVWYDTDLRRFGHDSSGGLRGMKGETNNLYMKEPATVKRLMNELDHIREADKSRP